MKIWFFSPLKKNNFAGSVCFEKIGDSCCVYNHVLTYRPKWWMCKSQARRIWQQRQSECLFLSAIYYFSQAESSNPHFCRWRCMAGHLRQRHSDPRLLTFIRGWHHCHSTMGRPPNNELRLLQYKWQVALWEHLIKIALLHDYISLKPLNHWQIISNPLLL